VTKSTPAHAPFVHTLLSQTFPQVPQFVGSEATAASHVASGELAASFPVTPASGGGESPVVGAPVGDGGDEGGSVDGEVSEASSVSVPSPHPTSCAPARTTDIAQRTTRTEPGVLRMT
jgi:hypothetical protein